MPSFSPPTELTTPPVSEDPIERARNPIGYALWRHYGNRPCGRDVYLSTDGVVSEEPPSTTYNADGSINQFGSDRISRYFQHGGTYVVTTAEQVLLEAAGFTVTP